VDRPSQTVRRCFAVLTIAWAAAVPAAAYVSAQPMPSPVVFTSSALVYAVGALVCHQLPARSFQLWGRQLPVCARCTGIYIGAALAAIAWLAGVRWLSKQPRSRLDSARGATRAAAWASVLNVATLVVEWTTGVVPSNGVRAAAGLTLGAAIAAAVLTQGERSDEVN
jgi:hypothetical protein